MDSASACGLNGPSPRPAREGARWLFPYLELAVALLAGGLWYLQGGSVWYAGPWPGPLPVVMLAAVFVARLVIFRPAVRLSLFDVALWTFVATAAFGVWAAYDRGPAWAKFWLIIGAVGIYYAVAHQPSLQHVSVALAVFSLLAACVGVYFLVTTDFAAFAAKLPVQVVFTDRLASWLPSVPGHRMHPNVVAGFLVTLMPLSVPLLGRSAGGGSTPRTMRVVLRLTGVLCITVAGVALFATVSRGAWLAAAVTGATWLAWIVAGRIAGRWARSERRAYGVRIAITGAALLAAAMAAATGVWLVLRGWVPGAATLQSRMDLLQSSLLLAGDYPYTGAGLGMFPMQFSVYTLLIHAPNTFHSHNMLFNIVLDQGLLGLASFVCMVPATVARGLQGRRAANGSWAIIIEAGLASVVAMLVHGLVNDVYSARTVLVMFVPFGVVAAAANGAFGECPSQAPAGRRESQWIGPAALTIVLALAIIGLLGPFRSSALANLGALAQARLELDAYDPDRWSEAPLDQVREGADLERAADLMERALAIEPGNRTARQRLAAVALARGQYRDALRHAEAAWSAGHRDSVTRLLLGDALVAVGEVERAAAVVRGLEWGVPRLQGNAWYRYWVSEDYRRAADSWSAVLLLEPGNEEAATMRARAEAKAQ